MRNQIIYTVTIILMLISCESEVKKESKTEKFVELIIETEQETKEEITVKSKFASIGCIACHQPKSKIVGPSLETIATAYKDNKEGLIAFLNGEGEAIVDLNQTAIMTPFIETTKAMDEIERAEIAAYILSGKY
ncbi:MAG: hypothetical protein COB15_10740 [Flavobacteriales bacterium]|nr:MAG: hypothetical protein COB15_10740 [Flavobacteriales bacterium]